MSTKLESDLRLASAVTLEVKAERSGHISGYASTFGGEADRHGDIVTAGAFAKSLSAHRKQGSVPAMLWAHQMEAPVGRWLTIEEDPKGLFVTGQVNLKTAAGREAYEHVEAGDVSAFSIGYTLPENGRRYLGKGTWALDQIDLAEVSLVAVPANPRALIASVKHLGSRAEAVDFLREAGLSKEAARRFAAGGFSALTCETIDADLATKLAARIERATQSLKGKL